MKRRRSLKRACGCGCLGVVLAFVGLVALGSVLPPLPKTPAAVSTSIPPATRSALSAAMQQPSDAPAQAAFITWTPSPAPDSPVGPTGTDVPVRPSATITDTPFPTKVVTYYVLKSQPINVRASASTTAAVIGQLQPAASIPVLDAVDGEVYAGNAHWYRVDYQGQTGYIHSSLLADHPVTPAPTAAPRQVVSTRPPAQQPISPVIKPPSSDPFGCNRVNDLNCSDFSSSAAANAHLALCGDEDNLDGDGDGRACE